jgi:hypothetical protein
VSGVTINGATTAGLAVVDSPGAGATGTVALEVSGNTAISSSAAGAIGILVSGANASANIHHKQRLDSRQCDRHQGRWRFSDHHGQQPIRQRNRIGIREFAHSYGAFQPHHLEYDGDQ